MLKKEGLLVLVFILCASLVSAANCGGTTACNCGDSLTSSRTLNASDNLLNCPANGIVIGANNVVLDCAGNIMNGSDTESGIFLESYNNVTVKNCIVQNFAVGINLRSATYANITNNMFYSDYVTSTGVYFWSMNNVTMTENNISYNDVGIDMWDSNYNMINRNRIYNSTTKDIRLNTGSGNNATLNYWGGYVCRAKISGITTGNVIPYYNDAAMTTLHYGPDYCCGDTVASSFNLPQNLTCAGNAYTIGASNVVVDCQGNTLTGPAASKAFYIDSVENVTVRNCTIQNFSYAVDIGTVTNVSVYYNTITQNTYGVSIQSASPIDVKYNRIYGNSNFDLGYFVSLGGSNFTHNYFGSGVCEGKFTTFVAANVTPYYTDAALTNLNNGPDFCCGETVTQDYTLQSDMNCADDGLVIGAPNIVIDCAGHLINGSNNYDDGISSSDYGNVTVKNCQLSNWGYGIHFYNSNYSKIQNNTVNHNDDTGVYLDRCYGNTLTGNTANLNYYFGIYFYYGGNNTLVDNIADFNDDAGIYLSYSHNNNITGGESKNNTDNSGTFWDGAGLVIEFSDNNSVQDIDITGNYDSGSYLSTASGNNLIGNTFSSNGNSGLYMDTSQRNILSDNVMDSNTYYGMYISSSSSDNTFTDDSLGSNGRDGIYITGSDRNTFTGTTITGTGAAYYDLNVQSSSDGLYLVDFPILNYTFTDTAFHLKTSSYGEISFTSDVTTSGTSLGNDVNIGSNVAYVNSGISGLNKSANITLYNVPTDKANYRILRNGVDCASNVCANITALDAGNVSFNVTGWSNYSIGWGVTSTPPSGGGGGGGGSYSTTFYAGDITGGQQDMTLKIGDALHFYSGIEEHTIKLLLVGYNFAVFQIASTPQQLKLYEGQSKELDINADSKNDISVKLVDILYNKILLQVTSLVPKSTQLKILPPAKKVTQDIEFVEEKPAEQQETVKADLTAPSENPASSSAPIAPTTPVAAEKKGTSAFVYSIIIALLAIVVISVVLSRRSKHHNQKH